jgi:hypothetical protein
MGRSLGLITRDGGLLLSSRRADRRLNPICGRVCAGNPHFACSPVNYAVRRRPAMRLGCSGEEDEIVAVISMLGGLD